MRRIFKAAATSLAASFLMGGLMVMPASASPAPPSPKCEDISQDWAVRLQGEVETADVNIVVKVCKDADGKIAEGTTVKGVTGHRTFAGTMLESGPITRGTLRELESSPEEYSFIQPLDYQACAIAVVDWVCFNYRVDFKVYVKPGEYSGFITAKMMSTDGKDEETTDYDVIYKSGPTQPS